MIDSSVFKAYDVRGLYPGQVTADLFHQLGRAFVAHLGPGRYAVSRDMRTSSPELAAAFIAGARLQGGHVVDYGLMGTDLMYYAVAADGLDGGAQITASHNPGEYNGCKMVKREAFPLSGDSGIKEMKEMILAGAIPAPPATPGTLETRDVLDRYTEHVLGFIDRSVIKPFDVVLDAGSGIAGIVAPKLFDVLPCKTTRLCFEVDGTFPNHEANPLIEENRRDITEKVIEPRLGEYAGERPEPVRDDDGMSQRESKGLKYATYALLAMIAVFALLTLPPGAPLRNPETGSLLADSPFMTGLIVFITLLFLAAGWAYGYGAGTMRNTVDVINAMEKAIRGLAGLIFLLFVISQFLAFFTYTNMATLAAVGLGDALEGAGLNGLTLLIGFIFVVAILDLIMTGAIPKWAIFAPVFVPLLMRLNVEPEAVLAAYRVGDSPFNAISPLNAYFALIVSFAMKYDPKAGVGTVIALMLPYVVVLFVVWTLLFAVWHLLGLPWGL